jgi:hypothetical protein
VLGPLALGIALHRAAWPAGVCCGSVRMRQERGALTTPAGRVDSAGEAVCYLSTVIYRDLAVGSSGMG